MALLQRLSKSIRKYKVCGFDIETQGKSNDFVLASLYFPDESRCELFYDKDKFRDVLLSRKYRSYRKYATNLMFDFFGTFQDWKTLAKNGIYIEPILAGGKMLQLKIKHPAKHTLTFADSLAICMVSVKELGKIIGINKMEKPEFKDYDKMTDLEKFYFKEYNMNDSKITACFIDWFQKEINNLGGEMRMTIGSTAMALFRKKFFSGCLIQCKKYYRDFIRQSYKGGRTEVFKRGLVENLNYYDVNSLYPSVMFNDMPHPNFMKHKNKGSIDNILKYHGFSFCNVTCPDNLNIPLLPYKHNGKLVFPKGTFQDVFTHIELRKALELGYKINSIGRQIYYTKNIAIFKEYMQTLYDLRLEFKKNKNPAEKIVKLLMNSLYGKFGQREIKRVFAVEGSRTFNKYWNLNKNNQEFEYDYEKGYAIFEVESCPNFVFVEFASTVTAMARLKLYSFMEQDPNSIYYCDTDSIFTSRVFPTSEKLGDLKLECVIKKGIIVKPKMYYINEQFKCKGIHGLTGKDFFDLLEGLSVKKIKFMKLLESERRHIKVNTIVEILKKTDLEDDKRVWIEKFNKNMIQESIPIIIN